MFVCLLSWCMKILGSVAKLLLWSDCSGCVLVLLKGPRNNICTFEEVVRSTSIARRAAYNIDISIGETQESLKL